MKKTWIAVCLSGFVLAACSGENDDDSTVASVSISDGGVAAGYYEVALGDSEAPTLGQYLATDSGYRLLIVNSDTEKALSLYHRANTKSAWQYVTSTYTEPDTTFLRTSARTLDAIDLESASGSYTALVNGAAATFSVDGKGVLAAAQTDCKISGSIATELVAGVNQANLTLSGCGTMSGNFTGVVIADSDNAAVSLRFVTDNGSSIGEIWAYREEL